MKRVWTILSVLAVANLAGILGFAGWLRLTDRLDPLAPASFDWSLLGSVHDQVRTQQELCAATGAAHAAAAFRLDDGTVELVREDIGRHNAVDKVIGRLLLDEQLPALHAGAAPLGLWVSGRASFEMVQKAWAGGFAVLASVSAPSALAVEVAERGGVALAGFARGVNLTVYTS